MKLTAISIPDKEVEVYLELSEIFCANAVKGTRKIIFITCLIIGMCRSVALIRHSHS
jgi:hypothetical protein